MADPYEQAPRRSAEGGRGSTSRPEAQPRPDLKRGAATARGPLVRLLLALTIAACLLAAATAIYGAFKFRDAPIRKTATGYAGKGGQPRTLEDFEAFVLWQRAMFVTFPSAMLLGLAYAIADARRRRRGP